MPAGQPADSSRYCAQASTACGEQRRQAQVLGAGLGRGLASLIYPPCSRGPEVLQTWPQLTTSLPLSHSFPAFTLEVHRANASAPRQVYLVMPIHVLSCSLHTCTPSSSSSSRTSAPSGVSLASTYIIAAAGRGHLGSPIPVCKASGRRSAGEQAGTDCLGLVTACEPVSTTPITPTHLAPWQLPQASVALVCRPLRQQHLRPGWAAAEEGRPDHKEELACVRGAAG